MRFIHPRKYWRLTKELLERIKNQWRLWRFKLEAQRCGVTLIMGEGVRMTGCYIKVEDGARNAHAHTHTHERKRCILEIGDYCWLKNARFNFYGLNSRIAVGERTVINAHKNGRDTYFWCGADNEIIIGEGCLLSDSIGISTTDFHHIYDYKGEKINKSGNVRLGKHVWVGLRVYISKGVELGQNTIVGASSVVTKSFTQGNCIIAGNPAVIKRESINWKP